jgi:hypothetical protein
MAKIKHEADLVKGSLYSYLGHWGQEKYLMQGHNDVDVDPETGDIIQMGNQGKSYAEDEQQGPQNGPMADATRDAMIQDKIAGAADNARGEPAVEKILKYNQHLQSGGTPTARDI